MKSQIFIKLKEMKNLIITSILAVLITSATTVRAQDYPREYLGLPGDNLNLYAVMDLFRNSETLEGFERNLNNSDSRINNLDLNGDNMVDYITVSDYVDRKVHTIVLRAVLGRNEYQDVAVFTVQKLSKKRVIIQLIGDEALYGRNYIIEPLIAKKPKQNFYGYPVNADNGTVINNYYRDICDWPVVVYICHPHYRGWHSAWHWGYYPDYWSPWRPYYWDFYFGYHSCWNHYYYTHYHHWDHPRYKGYSDIYFHGIRQQSPQVNHRLAEGSYRETYSRPDLRNEGRALYNRTQATGRIDSRRSPVATETRRPATPVTVQNTEERRRPATATDTRRSASTMTGRREIPSSGSVTGNSTGRRTEEIRVEEERASEQRAAEARESDRRAVENRTAEAREFERRASEQRAAEVKESERRTAENRAAEAREVEIRASEQRAAEARESERRASEQRAAEVRESERRAAENRAAEAREVERRAAEARANGARETERRAAEVRATEARETERRVTENKAAETRRSEIRFNSEERSGRPDQR